MSTTYAELLATKRPRAESIGHEPGTLHPSLFDFQRALTEWAIRKGRAAIFADTGLGKTRMQIEWAEHVPGPRLIIAPLAVAEQTIAEAERMEGRKVVWTDGSKEPHPMGTYITNYEKLHRFDPGHWAAVVLDESSILKSIDGKTRTKLIKEWGSVEYRLCCTATPAPNDIAELANHAEFLGVMTRPEMLATFFVHDERTWRLKGHAQEPFFRWLATWAAYVRRPSDLGFSDEGFDLPPLNIEAQIVSVDWQPSDESLFPQLAGGVKGRHTARRGSLDARVKAAYELAFHSADSFIIWCGLNAEQEAIAEMLGPDCVSIDGQTSEADRIARYNAWKSGEVRILVTKLTMFGFGMNMQHCSRMIFLGLGDSWEQYYQGIRRCWRFGQTEPVDVTIVVSDAESAIAQNVWRKEQEATRTAESVVKAMRSYERDEILGVQDSKDEYVTDEAEGEGWRLLLGDCVERLGELETASAGLSVHSPPFAALYTYSASERDLGNCKNYDEFFAHYRFAIAEILRVTKPGRRACVHVQQVTTTKTTHGVIGWRDFRADVCRAYVEAGFIYDGEVVIDKDPQAQAIRTKSKALMFVQKNKDSAWSRPAMADYILLFRAPGENEEPVKTDVSNEEWILWARPIWYSIRESETLQASAAREHKDEKHIAPLQLETVERCVRLWSNPSDLVLDPFAGIGTTGYVALQHDRRFVGIELKRAYWEQARKNLAGARAQGSLFEGDA